MPVSLVARGRAGVVCRVASAAVARQSHGWLQGPREHAPRGKRPSKKRRGARTRPTRAPGHGALSPWAQPQLRRRNSVHSHAAFQGFLERFPLNKFSPRRLNPQMWSPQIEGQLCPQLQYQMVALSTPRSQTVASKRATRPELARPPVAPRPACRRRQCHHQLLACHLLLFKAFVRDLLGNCTTSLLWVTSWRRLRGAGGCWVAPWTCSQDQ